MLRVSTTSSADLKLTKITLVTPNFLPSNTLYPANRGIGAIYEDALEYCLNRFDELSDVHALLVLARTEKTMSWEMYYDGKGNGKKSGVVNNEGKVWLKRGSDKKGGDTSGWFKPPAGLKWNVCAHDQLFAALSAQDVKDVESGALLLFGGEFHHHVLSCKYISLAAGSMHSCAKCEAVGRELDKNLAPFVSSRGFQGDYFAVRRKDTDLEKKMSLHFAKRVARITAANSTRTFKEKEVTVLEVWVSPSETVVATRDPESTETSRYLFRDLGGNEFDILHEFMPSGDGVVLCDDEARKRYITWRSEHRVLYGN
jgi:hypothetical protein